MPGQRKSRHVRGGIKEFNPMIESDRWRVGEGIIEDITISVNDRPRHSEIRLEIRRQCCKGQVRIKYCKRQVDIRIVVKTSHSIIISHRIIRFNGSVIGISTVESTNGRSTKLDSGLEWKVMTSHDVNSKATVGNQLNVNH